LQLRLGTWGQGIVTVSFLIRVSLLGLLVWVAGAAGVWVLAMVLT
jgi:hypothetical protein